MESMKEIQKDPLEEFLEKSSGELLANFSEKSLDGS